MTVLEQKTLKYWKIQSAYNQRPEVPMLSVSDAIIGLNTIIFSQVGPAKPLESRCWKLRRQIVYGNITDQELNQNV